jgi:hypothetical protein
MLEAAYQQHLSGNLRTRDFVLNGEDVAQLKTLVGQPVRMAINRL